MLEFLLYTTLTCKEADELMIRISKHDDLPALVKVELVETVKESAPECYWDAND
jgi:hypothetical protein